MAKVKSIPKSYSPSKLEVEAYKYCIKTLKIYFSMEHTTGGFYIVRGLLNDNLEGDKNFSYKRLDVSSPCSKKNRVVLDKVSAEKEVFRMYLETYKLNKK